MLGTKEGCKEICRSWPFRGVPTLQVHAYMWMCYGPGTLVSKLVTLQLPSLWLAQAPSKACYLIMLIILWTFKEPPSYSLDWIHPLLGKPMHMLMEYSYFSFIPVCEFSPNLPAHKTVKLRGCAEPFVSSPVVSKEVYILDIYQIVICLTGGYYILNFPKRWLTIMIHIFLGNPFPGLPFAWSGELHVSFLGVEEIELYSFLSCPHAT